MNLQPAGTEFDISAITAFDQINPAVAWGDGGYGLAVWQDWSGTQGDSGGTSVKGQLVRIDGTQIGEPFLINTQTAKSQGWPSVALLDGGGFVVVWQDLSRGPGDTLGASVRGQLLGPDGAKIGGEFVVNTSVNGDQFLPQVCALNGGGFAVSWNDAGSSAADSSGLAVRAQVFDAHAGKLGEEILVNSQTAGNQSAPVMARLAGGGFAAVWQDASGTLGDADGASIKLQLFAANGTPVGSETLVNTAAAGNQTLPALVALAGGGLVVAWEDRSGTNGDAAGSSIAAQIFGDDGTRIGSQLRLNAETAGDQTAPSLAALADGGFIAAWTDRSATLGDIEGTAIKARAFDAAGAATGDERLINTAIEGNQSNAALATLGNSGVIALWEDRGPRSGAALNNAADIRGQVLLDAGAAPVFMVDPANSGGFHVAENGRSAATVAAYDADPLHVLSYRIAGGADAALFRIDAATGTLRFRAAPDHENPFDANGDNVYVVKVAVSNGSDVVSKTISVVVDDVLNETISGTAKADFLLGADGDDVLNGRSGDDDMFGEAGNDRLDGGAGADHMEGGAGNDVYIADNALDHTHEKAGGGTDTVRASVSFVLDDDVEHLVLTGSAAIGGTGNALDNNLYGNNAGNLLRGGAGNDRLIGRGGDDTLAGGAGHDVLVGGAGRDTFVFNHFPASNAEADRITDFAHAEHDVLRFSRNVFGGFAQTGMLSADAFYSATGARAAHDSTDRVIYDPASGKLFYDSDGTGAAGAVLVAILGDGVHPDLVHQDLLITV